MLAETADPERGHAERQMQAAAAAERNASRNDPDISRVFDGGGRVGGLEVEEVGRSGYDLLQRGRKLSSLTWVTAGYLYAHPTISGAAVHLFDEGHPADARVEDIDAAGEAAAVALGRAALGARVFGTDVVFGGRITGPRPMNKIYVKERIYAHSLTTMVQDEKVKAADKELIAQLLLRAVAAGFSVSGLEIADIVLGNTLADPERRAYVMDPARIKFADPAASSETLAAGVVNWMRELDASIHRWAIINAQARARGGSRVR
jgi:hypothetical protein